MSLRNQACCIMQLLDSYSHTWRNVIQIGLKDNVRLKRHIISMQNTQNEHNLKMQYQHTNTEYTLKYIQYFAKTSLNAMYMQIS